MRYRIVSTAGHVEVLDEAGNFILSADTVSEANRELEEMEDKGEKAG